MLIEFVIKLSRASCSYFHIKRFIKFDKNCVTALTVTYIEFKKELTDNQADCQPMNKAVCGSSTGLIKGQILHLTALLFFDIDIFSSC